jgi:hypothetical protein
MALSLIRMSWISSCGILWTLPCWMCSRLSAQFVFKGLIVEWVMFYFVCMHEVQLEVSPGYTSCVSAKWIKLTSFNTTNSFSHKEWYAYPWNWSWSLFPPSDCKLSYKLKALSSYKNIFFMASIASVATSSAPRAYFILSLTVENYSTWRIKIKMLLI